jgi:hypothetical protein
MWAHIISELRKGEHNGGSGARLLGLFARKAMPTTAAQTAAKLYFYASPALGVNFRFCRM